MAQFTPNEEVHESVQRTYKKNGKTRKEHGKWYTIEETLGFCTKYIQEVIPTRRTMWDDNEDPTMHDEILEGNGHPRRLSADLKA